MDSESILEHCSCHYMPDLVVVAPGRAEEAADRVGGSPLDHGAACRFLDGLDPDIVAQILENLGIVQLADGDPHVASRQLIDSGIPASPVHGVGFLGHKGFQGALLETPGDHIEEVGPGREGIVAVVDSGLAPDEDLPDWMRNPSVIVERPIDTEHLTYNEQVSHGTFVTSRIRSLAPEQHVSLTSARPDPGYLTTDETPHSDKQAPRPTDELNVLGAVLRLLRRHDGDTDVRALSMALGVHECPGGGVEMLALRKAVELWTEQFGDRAPIVAAAGNSTCPEPIYPAAWSSDETLNIMAVAAACEGEGGIRQVVWDLAGAEVDPPAPRDWVTDAAPGCAINGLTGQAPDHTGHWGGSSFATAAVAAWHASGGGYVEAGGIRWWPHN